MSAITPAAFSALLIASASEFVGLSEVKQNATWDNPATQASEKPLSDRLRALMHETGWTEGEPYCAAFAGAAVIDAARRAGLDPAKFLSLWTPHCMTNVRAFLSRRLISLQPSPASLMLMRHGETDSGHAALCVSIEGTIPNRNLHTIEGNTMPGTEGDQRQGDGIYARVRNVFRNGNLQTQGWITTEALLTLLQ